MANKYSNWCFTLNNYTADDELKLKAYYDQFCRYMIYGHEEGSETHTPHLQGYIQLKNRDRLDTIKKKMLLPTIHLEVQRAKDNDAAKTYCQKDGNNIVEYGQFVQKGSNKGKKNDLYDFVMSASSWNEVLANIKPFQLHYAEEVWKTRPITLPYKKEDFKLYNWQLQLLDLLKKPDPRTIYIVCDPIGNKGKSYLCNYLEDFENAFVTTPMKTADILLQYNNEPIVAIDMPRYNDDEFHMQGAIEILKNGRGRSGKYKGHRLYRPFDISVVIFSNSRTGLEIAEKFSSDRVVLCYFDRRPQINEPNISETYYYYKYKILIFDSTKNL